MVKELVDQRDNTIVSVLRVFNFVPVDVTHLAGVPCEVIRETCLVAEFRDEEDWHVLHVHEKQWLIGVGDRQLVCVSHVVNQICFVLLETAALDFAAGLKELVFGSPLPVQAIDLVRLGVVLRHDRPARLIRVLRVEEVRDVPLIFASLPQTSDFLQNCCLLDELAHGVDVQENAVVDQPGRSQVTRPHLKLVPIDIPLVFGHEVLRKSADLLVVVCRQRVFHQNVQEIENLGHKWALLSRHYIQAKLLADCESKIALSALSIRRNHEVFVANVPCHGENVASVVNKPSNSGLELLRAIFDRLSLSVGFTVVYRLTEVNGVEGYRSKVLDAELEVVGNQSNRTRWC